MAQDNESISTDTDGRFWIEILSWDWSLAVVYSTELTPIEQRFQGGLDYVRDFQLWGRVVAPQNYKGKTVRIWIAPFGPDMRFGPNEMDEVGRLYLSPAAENKADWSLSLMLPENAIAPLATCLGTVSKYLYIRLFNAEAVDSSIDYYSFSSILPNLGEIP